MSHCGLRELALHPCLSHQIMLQVTVGDAGNVLLCHVGSQGCEDGGNSLLCHMGSWGCEEIVPWGQQEQGRTLQQHCLCRS